MTEKIIAAALILGTAGLWASTALKGSPEPTPIVSTAPEIVIPQPPAPNDKILTPGIDYPFPPAAGPNSSHAAHAPSVPTSAGAVYTQPAQEQPQQYYARRPVYGRWGRFLGYETVLVTNSGGYQTYAVCASGSCSAGGGFHPFQRLFGRRR